MTDEEKLYAVRQVLSDENDRNDFMNLARHSEVKANELALMMFRQHEQSGDSIDSVVRSELDSFREEMRRIVACSGLSRTTQWRIMKNPIGEWEKLVDGSSERRKSHDYGLHIIISNDSNELLGVLPFIDRVVFSILCKACEKGVLSLSFRELWCTMHQSRDYRKEGDKEGFIQAVKMSIARLESIFHRYTIEQDRILVHFHTGDSKDRRKPIPRIYEEASNRRLIMDIPREMVSTGSHLNIVQRLYIAYRIRLTEHKDSRMKTVISVPTMERDTGMRVSVNAVRGYMNSIADSGRIESPVVTSGKISWKKKED